MPTFSAQRDSALDTVFTPPSQAQWVESALAGLAPDCTLDSLRKHTLDGLQIRVLYDDSPIDTGQSVSAATSAGDSGTPSTECPWDNRLCVRDVAEESVSNRMILDGLRGGNSSIELHLDQSVKLESLLDGVLLDLAPVSLRAGDRFASAAELFVEHASRRSFTLDSLHCSFNADPLGHCLQTGVMPASLDSELSRMATFSQTMSRVLPAASTVLVDAAAHHNAGASVAQELQAAIATGTLYLKCLMDEGMSVEQASRAVVFQLACDADLLMGVVKQRSLKLLWQHILALHETSAREGTGGKGGDGGNEEAAGERHRAANKLQLVVETSRRYLTCLDPWNNHLRNIAACVAAAMGGASTIIVHPHDRIGAWQSAEDPAIGTRMARNLPIILQRESGLTLVSDPLAGSMAVDTLTADLTALVWQALAEMGDTDAWWQAIATGQWQAAVADTQQRRLALVRQGKQVVVGVNRYIMPAAGTTLASAVSRIATSHAGEPVTCKPAASGAMPPVRDAELYEAPATTRQGESA
jgi:methylmalonyl-CoA mutase